MSNGGDHSSRRALRRGFQQIDIHTFKMSKNESQIQVQVGLEIHDSSAVEQVIGEQTADEMIKSTPEFCADSWLQLAPDLHIGDAEFLQTSFATVKQLVKNSRDSAGERC